MITVSSQNRVSLRQATLTVAAWLVAVAACQRKDDRPLPGAVRQQPALLTSSASPSPSAPPAQGAQEPAPKADAADVSAGPSYLIVLRSWKSGARNAPLDEDRIDELVLRSVRTAEGFPRRAKPHELAALRSGYDAVLAGVCRDLAAATEAVKAIGTERFEPYLKTSSLGLEDTCPVPEPSWRLAHDLYLEVQSDAPDRAEKLEQLLRRGASPNHRWGGTTALDVAAYNNDIESVRLLLKHGAELNRPERRAQEPSTLEHAIATPYGDPWELVTLLVAHRADVNAVTEGAEADPGSSVSIMAIRACHPRVLELLYQRGARRDPVASEEVCERPGSSSRPELDRPAILRLIEP